MRLKRLALTPEEEIVLDAIVAQRSESWTDWFRYDYMKAQDYITEKGAFTQYNIDLCRQFEILENFSKKNVIMISECIVTPADPERGLWMSLMEWAYNCIDIERIEGPGAADNNRCAIFIKMSLDDIGRFYGEYKAKHTVQLKLDVDHLCLSIQIDHGEWIQLSHLHDNKPPFKILQYAYKRPNKTITREELIKYGRINLGKKYLKSQIFSDNSTVNALPPSLLDIKKDSIIFITKPVKMNLAELDVMKDALKII